MQNIGTARIGTTGHPYYRRRTDRHKQGNDPKAENCSPERGCNDFLKAVIEPIYPKAVTNGNHFGAQNIALTRAVWEHLRDSAMNYARLLGRRINLVPTGDVCKDIVRLYDALSAILPRGQGLNIEPDENRLVFCIWQEHRWEDDTFFWLPIRFIEELRGGLKRLAITFIGEFARNNNIPFLYQLGDMDYALEILNSDLADQEWENKDERREMAKLLDAYESGRILKLQKRVANRSYYKRLPAALARYKPQNKREEKLIALMQRGLQFIGRDKPSIMSYQYEPDYDPDNENTVPLYSIIRIIYDENDCIEDWLSEMANDECQNNGVITPFSTCVLSPQTDRLFTKDDYPERFCDWFLDFTRFTYKKHNE